MAVWNVVETDFGGDETGNFGARCESGTKLYQLDTNATIEPQGQVTRNPVVCSSVIEETIAVAAGSHLSMFQDSCHQYAFSLSFDSEAECVATTDDSQFVALGENAGKFHFIHIEGRRALFSKTLVKANNNGPSFRHILFTPLSGNGVCECLVLTSDGVIHVFRNLQLTLLCKAILDKDLGLAQTLQSKMSHLMIDTQDYHREGARYIVPSPSYGIDTIITAGDGETCLCIWERGHDKYEVVDSVASLFSDSLIKKCASSQCGTYLLTLDESGVMSLWSTHMLTILRQWTNLNVEDFLILETGETNGTLSCLKVVLKTQANEGKCSLKICTLPDMEAVYNLQLNDPTTLAYCSPTQEAIFLIEGVAEEEDNTPNQVISSLRIRCLTEAQPETRLSRILHKEQFEEAEQFARLYNLNVELVFRVKATHLLDILSPWHVNKLTLENAEEYYKQLKEALKEITDDSDVVKCCVKACLPWYDATLELLNYARQRLNDHMSGINGYQDGPEDIDRPALLTWVLSTLHRLATFQVAYGISNFKGTTWDKFRNADLLSEFEKLLSHGKTDIAFSIWDRHQAEFEEDFNAKHLDDILSVIPETIGADALKPWLSQTFMPFVIRQFPEGLNAVAGWVEDRARNMEVMEKDGWPMNALQFAELLQTTCVSVTQVSNADRGLATANEFSTQVCNMSVGYTQVNGSQGAGSSDNFVRLHKLISQLKDLISLHTKYNCKLTLAECTKETTETLTFRMLDRVAALELIPPTLEKIVRPYMKEHNLNEEVMLYKYVGDLAQRSAKIHCVGEAPWEAKAIAIIACIKDPEYKCLAILDAMQRAYVPFSADMDDLVKQGLALTHPRVEQLKEKCKLIELRKMLTNYDLRNFNVSQPERAEILVYYILSQDRSSAVEDALAIVGYDLFSQLSDIVIYIFRLRFLIEDNRLPECISLLESLPTEKAITCAKRLITHTEVELNQTLILDEAAHHKELTLYTKAACECIKFLLKLDELDQSDREIYTDLLGDLQKIHQLQVEFSEFVTYKDFVGDIFRQTLMAKHVKIFFANKGKDRPKIPTDPDRKTGNLKWNYVLVYRLAALLKIPRDTLKGQLSITAARTGQVSQALKLAKELNEYVPGEETAEVLYKVAHILCVLLKGNRPLEEGIHIDFLSEAIHNLASQALTYCNPVLLPDCLELCRCSSMAQTVIQQSETGEYGSAIRNVGDAALTDSSNKDPYKAWTFEHFFKEDSLVMESSVATPLVYSYAVACLPRTEPLPHHYVQNRVPGTSILLQRLDKDTRSGIFEIAKSAVEMTQYLRENSQVSLALAFAIDTLGVALQYNSVETMGLKVSKEVGEIRANEGGLIAKTVLSGIKAVNDLTITLLMKVYNQSRIDREMALGFMCGLPKQTVFEGFKKVTNTAGHQYKKVLALAKIGADYSELIKELDKFEACKKLETNATWGHKLSKIKISFTEVFNRPSDQKANLLPTIVQNPYMTLSILLEYCSSFKGINEQEALFLYLEHLLAPQTRPGSGDAHSVDISQTLYKAKQTIQALSKSEALYKKLYQVLHKVDMFDYERLQFVLQEMDSLQEFAAVMQYDDEGSANESSLKGTYPNKRRPDEGLKLLKYLTNYKRMSAPTSYELNYKNFTEEDEIMQCGRHLTGRAVNRLPFHPLLYGHAWKIVTPELNSDTVSMWIPICSVVQLAPDEVYLTTIKNILSQHIENKKNAGGDGLGNATAIDKSKCNWGDEGIDKKFFQSLNTLLHKVKDNKLSVTCVSHVVKELPMGAEKVLALHTAVSLTEKWVKACPEKPKTEQEVMYRNEAIAAYKKFAGIFRRLSTEQVLYHHQLGDIELVDLATTPSRLIFKLYEHSSILKRTSTGTKVDSLPDIHFVANKIAQINSVNVSKIRLNLVEKWLPSTQSKEDLNETVTFNFNINFNQMNSSKDSEEQNEDEINLKRVTYLLQNGDVEKNAIFLLNYAYKSDCLTPGVDNSKITNMCRVRALRILFSLVDKVTIEKHSNQSIQNIKEYLQDLLYLVELEHIHSPMSIEAFKKCNKEGLVKGIWRNHSSEKRSVRLVADLCLDYDIYDTQLWNSVLQQLLGFKMSDYLRHALVCLSGVPDLWQVLCIQKMWRTVLLQSLADVVLPLSDEQLDESLQSYSLLHRCPLLLDMDMQTLCRQYLRLELHVPALGCLLLIPTPSKGKGAGFTPQALIADKVTMCLGSLHPTDILDVIRKWTQEGRSVPMADQIRDAVFIYIDHGEKYEILRGTPYLEEFTFFLIKKQMADRLLLYLIKQDKMPQALQLVNSILSHRYTEAKPTGDQPDDPMLKLKTYLKKQGLYHDVIEYFPSAGDYTTMPGEETHLEEDSTHLSHKLMLDITG